MPFLFKAEQKKELATGTVGFVAVERPRVYGPGVIALLTIFGVAFVAWALLFSFRVKVDADTELIRRQTDDLERTRDYQLEKQIITFEKRVNALSKILRSHVYISKLIPALEEATLPSVFYESLSVSFGTEDVVRGGKAEKADIVRADLAGSAATLLDLARQMIAYREQPTMVKGDISGFSIGKEGGGRITFTASLLIDKKVILTP